MTEKFCSSCRSYKRSDLGYSVKNKQGKVVRWRCSDCQVRAVKRLDLPDKEQKIVPDDKEN